MAAINYDSELRRAGAQSTHGWRKLLFLAQRHVLGAIGLTIMVMFVLSAVFADLICRYSPLAVDSAHALGRPSAQHWMGTDSFGRDVWSRIIHGARISLAVGIGSTALLAAWAGILANSVFVDTLHWRHLWLVAGLIWAASQTSSSAGTRLLK